jgi:hypothetical protein
MGRTAYSSANRAYPFRRDAGAEGEAQGAALYGLRRDHRSPPDWGVAGRPPFPWAAHRIPLSAANS